MSPTESAKSKKSRLAESFDQLLTEVRTKSPTEGTKSEKSRFAESLDLLLTEKETSELICLSPRWLQKKRLEGGGIPFVRVSSRCIRYRLRDVLNWMESHTKTSTSEV